MSFNPHSREGVANRRELCLFISDVSIRTPVKEWPSVLNILVLFLPVSIRTPVKEWQDPDPLLGRAYTFQSALP